MNQAALSVYKTIGAQGGVMDASPHQLISMLLTGVQDRVASAKGAIARGETGRRGELLSSAIAIVDSLRASLDRERGGEIAINLSMLYDYMEQLLVQANLAVDGSELDEVGSLLAEIRNGWDSIPSAERQI